MTTESAGKQPNPFAKPDTKGKPGKGGKGKKAPPFTKKK